MLWTEALAARQRAALFAHQPCEFAGRFAERLTGEDRLYYTPALQRGDQAGENPYAHLIPDPDEHERLRGLDAHRHDVGWRDGVSTDSSRSAASMLTTVTP